MPRGDLLEPGQCVTLGNQRVWRVLAKAGAGAFSEVYVVQDVLGLQVGRAAVGLPAMQPWLFATCVTSTCCC